MVIELWMYPVLFLTGLVAGMVDAMAGGGGIITIPVLLNLGVPPAFALGTNKLQASFGSVSAAWHFSRAGTVDWKACRIGVITTLIGSVAGAIAVQRIDGAVLGDIIPWLLGGIFVYTLLRPEIGTEPRAPRLSPRSFFCGFGLALGFYDGFFGPGTGSFWTFALVLLLGADFLRATAHTKVMNATSNVAALASFLFAGKVYFGAGLLMGAGQLIGARIGSKLVLTKGARFVRPIFLVMVVLTLTRLIYVRLTQ